MLAKPGKTNPVPGIKTAFFKKLVPELDLNRGNNGFNYLKKSI